MPNFSVKASASSADSGAVPDVTARMPSRSSRRRSECNTIRSAAGTSDTARGRCLRTASAHVSRSNRSSSANGLASATHCSTRNTPPMCTSGALTIATPRRTSVGAGDVVRFGTHHAVRQHVVGEVDSLRRTGGAAGQHPHRDTGSAGTAAAADAQQLRLGVERRYRDHRRSGVPADQLRQIVGVADDHRQVQRGDVGLGAVVAAGRVDDDDRPAGQQHPEERGDVGGPVAQQHPDLAAARRPATRSAGPASPT